MRVLTATLSALFASAIWLGAFHGLLSDACRAMDGIPSGVLTCTMTNGQVVPFFEVVRPWIVVSGTAVAVALGYALSQQVVRVLFGPRGGA